MITEENKAVLVRVFDALDRGDPRPFRDSMADDVRWVFPGEWSWAGSWVSKPVVLDGLLRPLMRQFRSYESRADLIVAEGDRVVVQARSRAVTRRGDPYNQTYCYVFRVRDERIVEVIEHCDTALVERVLDRVEGVRPLATAK